MEERIDISNKLKTKEDIDKYLHPKSRSRFKMILSIHKDIFKDKKNIYRYLIYGLAGGLMPVLSAYVISWLINIIESIGINGSHNIGDGKEIIISVGIYSLIYLSLYIITTQINSRMITEIIGSRMGVVNKVMYKTTRIDLPLFMDSRIQDSLGNYFDSLQSSSTGYEGILRKVFQSMIPLSSFIIFSLILIKISPWLPIIGLVGIIISSFGQNMYVKYFEKKRPEFSKLERIFDRITYIGQDFNYGKDIRIFSMQGLFMKLNGKFIKNYEKLLKDLRNKKAFYTIFQALSFAFIDVGIIYLIINKYFNGNINLANFVMTLSISSIYVNQIIEIAKAISFVYQESVYMNYLYDFLDAKIVSEGGLSMKLEDFDNFDIKFDDVWFKYPGSEHYVLKGISFDIPEGKSLALVGVNGAGKTTITNLLTGLYLPTKGTITIGGINISKLSFDTLNRIIAMVFQSYEPLAMKVKENVACENEKSGNINDERVIDSLKKADIYEKISSFDKGINSIMLRVLDDDGMVLSGGENQKLSIARALYKVNTGLIIFDEPTSALDALAEEELYMNFSNLTKGKSSLFISHRLASTRFCEKILLLNNGKIEEFGSHEELLKIDGLYRKMYMTQASYYKEDSKDEG